MKKLALFAACLAAIQISAAAVSDVARTDERPITTDQLPAAAQSFLKEFFSAAKVAFATIDKEIMDTSYDVMFDDGSKVEFNAKGEWKSVDMKGSAVPAGIVPAQIADYVQKNHSGNQIREIDRGSRDYEVKLNNGLEIKFDRRFRVVGYDD